MTEPEDSVSVRSVQEECWLHSYTDIRRARQIELKKTGLKTPALVNQ